MKATLWLEEKYHQAPDPKLAMVIALHYLLLAMRQDSEEKSEIAKEYFSRAAQWRQEAGRQVWKHAPPETFNRNELPL